jgi:hypothetical protein
MAARSRRRARWLVGLVAALVLAAVVALLVWRDRSEEPARGEVRPGARATESGAGEAPVLQATAQPRAVDFEALLRESSSSFVRKEEAVVVGRVVDAAWRPVTGARVRVFAQGEPRGPTAETSVEGRFRLPFPRIGVEHVRCTLVASAEPHLVATAGLPTPQGLPLDVGVLVLQPTATLRVRVLENSAPVPAATVRLHLSDRTYTEVSKSAPQWGEAWRHAATNREGVAEFADVPHEPVRIVALGPGGGHAERWIADAGEEREPVALHLRPGRTLTVEVVEESTGRPMAGCGIEVRDWDWTLWKGTGAPPVTGADGITTLSGLPREDLYVKAFRDSWSWPQVAFPVPATATRHRLIVPQLVDFEWEIESGDGEPPAEGETVSITSPRWIDLDGVVEPVGMVVDGRLRVEVRYPTFLRAIATLADGRMAYLMLAHTNDVWRPVGAAVFREPRTISVTVKEEAGGPAAGVAVLLKDRSGRRMAAPVLTDAEGNARVVGLPAIEIAVRVSPEPGMVPLERLDAFTEDVPVDLRSGDGQASFTVRPRRELLVVVKHADGRPFDEPYALDMNAFPSSLHWRTPDGVTFDRAAGTARWTLRLPPRLHSVRMRASAAGYAPAVAKALVTDAGGFEPLELRMERAGAVRLRLLAPPDGRSNVRLERRGTDGLWTAVESFRPRASDDGVDHVFDGLVPGPYRLRDLHTGLTSETLDLRAGPAAGTLVLDLSRAGWLEGTLELPEVVPPDDVVLTLAGAGLAFDDVIWSPSDFAPRRRVGAKFRVRIPGDREITVTAEHPRCRPDPRDGVVRAVAPSTGHRLRLLAK